MTDYTNLVKALRWCANNPCSDECQWWHPDRKREVWSCVGKNLNDAAAAIEALQAEVERLQGKLCDWCAVCPKERRNPDDCELLGENPVMYGPSGAKMEVQDG